MSGVANCFGPLLAFEGSVCDNLGTTEELRLSALLWYLVRHIRSPLAQFWTIGLHLVTIDYVHHIMFVNLSPTHPCTAPYPVRLPPSKSQAQWVPGSSVVSETHTYVRYKRVLPKSWRPLCVVGSASLATFNLHSVGEIRQFSKPTSDVCGSWTTYKSKTWEGCLG